MPNDPVPPRALVGGFYAIDPTRPLTDFGGALAFAARRDGESGEFVAMEVAPGLPPPRGDHRKAGRDEEQAVLVRLAAAMIASPDEVLRRLRLGVIERWIRRDLGDPTLARRVERSAPAPSPQQRRPDPP